MTYNKLINMHFQNPRVELNSFEILERISKNLNNWRYFDERCVVYNFIGQSKLGQLLYGSKILVLSQFCSCLTCIYGSIFKMLRKRLLTW